MSSLEHVISERRTGKLFITESTLEPRTWGSTLLQGERLVVITPNKSMGVQNGTNLLLAEL